MTVLLTWPSPLPQREVLVGRVGEVPARLAEGERDRLQRQQREVIRAIVLEASLHLLRGLWSTHLQRQQRMPLRRRPQHARAGRRRRRLRLWLRRVRRRHLVPA